MQAVGLNPKHVELKHHSRVQSPGMIALSNTVVGPCKAVNIMMMIIIIIIIIIKIMQADDTACTCSHLA